MLQSLCCSLIWLCKNWKKFLVDVTLVKCCWQPLLILSSQPQPIPCPHTDVLQKFTSTASASSSFFHLLSSSASSLFLVVTSLFHPTWYSSYILSNSLLIPIRNVWSLLYETKRLLTPKETSCLYHSLPPALTSNAAIGTYLYHQVFSFLQLLNHLPDPVLSTSNFTTASTFPLVFIHHSVPSSLFSSIPSSYCTLSTCRLL